MAYSLLERDYYGQVRPHLSLDGWRQAVDPVTLKVLYRSVGLALSVTFACLALCHSARQNQQSIGRFDQRDCEG